MRLLCLALLVALGACAPDPESPAAETAPRADGPTEQAIAIDAEVAAVSACIEA